MDNVMVIGHLNAVENGLEGLLHDQGVDLVQCDDTQAGIAGALEREPALVFVEVDSPGADNYEVLSQLRDTQPEDFQIVAVCNRYGAHNNDVCVELGADFTIPQTDDRVNVALLIRGLLGMRRPVSRYTNVQCYLLGNPNRARTPQTE